MLLIRKNERREVRRATPIACQVVRESDFRLIGESATDLSPDGMMVSLPERIDGADLAPGEAVIVSFYATELNLWFDAEATIARVVRGRRPGDRGRGIAIAFKELDRVKRLILRGYLRRVPPPVPKRKQRIDWSATVLSLQPGWSFA